jgi:hypothetical protein
MKAEGRAHAKRRRKKQAKLMAWDEIRLRGRRCVTPSDDVVDNPLTRKLPRDEGAGPAILRVRHEEPPTCREGALEQ